MTVEDTDEDDDEGVNPVESDDEFDDVVNALERDLVRGRQILNGEESFHSAQRGSELLGPSASVGDDFRGVGSSDDNRRVQIPTWAVSVSRAPATAEHGGRFAIVPNREGHDLLGIGESSIREDPDRVSPEDTGHLHCPHHAVLLVMLTWRTQKASIGLWESQDLKVAPTVMDADIEVPPPRPDVLREAWLTLDEIDVCRIFNQRAAVMKSVPHCLKGPFRTALKLAFEQILETEDQHQQERGWKLMMLLPRMLLHRPPGGGLIARDKLLSRVTAFTQGQWSLLINASQSCDAKSAVSRRRSRRRGNDLDQRATRAEMLVQVGELSAARQALEGAELAPGNQATLNALKDPARRPPRPREALPPDLLAHTPDAPFDLDEHIFNRNLRSSRRGTAGGPSGMTTEHLRPLLDDMRSLHLFFRVSERLARAQIPEGVADLLRLGRITALSKPDGGVRGIVAGDVVRRLVARTIAKQLSTAVERATSPHQYALATRAGVCVAHVLQGLTEVDPLATVTSIDGISAFDLISRGAMLEGLRQVRGGSAVVPFARLLYGRPSEYLWEDASGEVHRIPQGEVGEQGDAMMPLLFSLGQQGALNEVQRLLQPTERLFAYLDDIYFVCRPERGGFVCCVAGCTEEACWHSDPLRENPDLEQSRCPASGV